MNFTVDQTGSYFVVLIFDNYVIKIPRKFNKETQIEINEMVELQNKFAENIEEVLPIENYGSYLKMPRAKGVRCDEITNPDVQKAIAARRDEIVVQIKNLGYKPVDVSNDNMFYDGENLYIVDFHLFYQKKKKRRKR